MVNKKGSIKKLINGAEPRAQLFVEHGRAE